MTTTRPYRAPYRRASAWDRKVAKARRRLRKLSHDTLLLLAGLGVAALLVTIVILRGTP